ncbi:AAA family ATPase [Acuticoccus sp. M5D2P5]|uniref:AAA family ATPase n=1 Tax=Acuticoccus kalidii TaxID=2910977 RepID=UPI001F3EBF63|nr:AAA family ATPase [Acuticoccus kalidii]MCF3934155.1 AAA family ATPase [Acuticoccus kalidii]
MQSAWQWLVGNGFEDFADRLVGKDVDLDVLRNMSLADLRARGLDDPSAKRLQLALRSAVSRVTKEQRAVPTVSERRLLTLLFCDLIDSTVLSARLDPEDWAEVLSSYIETVARHAEGHAGFVAKVVGDGVFVYFGYPTGHEDDAARAMHAAIATTESVRSLAAWPDVELGVRIGIATGPVVVRAMAAGDFTEHQAVVGETPNLAARLQGVANPNWVVVSDETHDLAPDEFDYEDLGYKRLRGFDEPIRCWRVLAARRLESRFLANHARGGGRFVGREEEIAALFECWRLARAGHGRVVLVEGEAGIGKSRLVGNLYASARDEKTMRLIFQCAELNKDTALHPVSTHFEFICRIKAEDDLATRLTKLTAFVRANPVLENDSIALIARLMSIRSGVSDEIAALPPQEFRTRLFAALTDWMRALSRKQPLFVVVEDIHWIDATTAELLNHLVREIGDAPILVVLTSRGGGFAVPSDLTLKLGRLEVDEARRLVTSLIDGTTLSSVGLSKLVEQTDGNPLFIQHAVQMLAKRSSPDQEIDVGGLGRSVTLQQVLQARLDNLGRNKRVAQFASLLGRQFTGALLHATWPFEDDGLDEGLIALEEEGLLEARRYRDGVEYRFAHALIVDAAYSSLLRRDRRVFHRHIAQVLETSFADLTDREPHILARHHAAGGDAATAIPFFLKSAELSLARSAYVEARNHIEQAIAILPEVADPEARDRLELTLRPAYGAALTATRGYAVDEVSSNYRRILTLARQYGDVRSEFHALLGLTRYSIVRADIAKGRALSGDLLITAHALGQPELVMTAELLVGITEMMTGNLAAAGRHLSNAHAAYDPVRDRQLAHRLGQDPYCTTLVWLAMHAWLGGHVTRYAERRAEALSLARELDHPFTLGYTLVRLLALDRLSGDLDAARALAAEAIDLTRQRGFPAFKAAARFWLADLAPDRDTNPVHLDTMEREISAHAPTDQRNNIGYMQICLAERALVFGDTARAERALDGSAAAIEETEVRWCEAELYRFRGRLAVARGERDAAIHWFYRAVELAAHQGACFLRLRAGVDLATLQAERGELADAIDTMSTACHSLADEADSDELDKARAFLADLQAQEAGAQPRATAH